jgi:hypothetical protein
MSLRLQAVLGSLIASAILSQAAPAADSAAPDYVVISLQAQVNRPAEQVWKHVGDYCAISEWLKTSCQYASGTGDVGTVRVINNTTFEPMVSRTAWSYTYSQSAGTMAANSYHGTVAVEPDGQGKALIKYTLFYNQAAMPSDAVRASERARLTARFQGVLAGMKASVEAQP